jgi:hypothetical protein
MFDLWTLLTVEDEEREEWSTYKLCTVEEQGVKLGVLALSSMSGVKEPNRCVDADAKSTKIGRISFITINDSDKSERLQSSRRSEDLSYIRGSDRLR